MYSNNTCVTDYCSGDPKFYYSNFTCKKCHFSCKGCFGPNRTNCLDCYSGYKLNYYYTCEYEELDSSTKTTVILATVLPSAFIIILVIICYAKKKSPKSQVILNQSSTKPRQLQQPRQQQPAPLTQQRTYIQQQQQQQLRPNYQQPFSYQPQPFTYQPQLVSYQPQPNSNIQINPSSTIFSRPNQTSARNFPFNPNVQAPINKYHNPNQPSLNQQSTGNIYDDYSSGNVFGTPFERNNYEMENICASPFDPTRFAQDQANLFDNPFKKGNLIENTYQVFDPFKETQFSVNEGNFKSPFESNLFTQNESEFEDPFKANKYNNTDIIANPFDPRTGHFGDPQKFKRFEANDIDFSSSLPSWEERVKPENHQFIREY